MSARRGPRSDQQVGRDQVGRSPQPQPAGRVGRARVRALTGAPPPFRQRVDARVEEARRKAEEANIGARSGLAGNRDLKEGDRDPVCPPPSPRRPAAPAAPAAPPTACDARRRAVSARAQVTGRLILDPLKIPTADQGAPDSWEAYLVPRPPPASPGDAAGGPDWAAPKAHPAVGAGSPFRALAPLAPALARDRWVRV
jgi:hypothetical protein